MVRKTFGRFLRKKWNNLPKGSGSRKTFRHRYNEGARVHNLKTLTSHCHGINLLYLLGVSGSGKSSLAFDTIYAEGQRRYVESLSSYARQFLERMEKPDVDLIQGISPAIAIEQKTTSRNPRSTVATTSEIYDYFACFWAHRTDVLPRVRKIGEARYGEHCGWPAPARIGRDKSVRDVPNAWSSGKNKWKRKLMYSRSAGFSGLWWMMSLLIWMKALSKQKSKKGINILVDRLLIRKKWCGKYDSTCRFCTNSVWGRKRICFWLLFWNRSSFSGSHSILNVWKTISAMKIRNRDSSRLIIRLELVRRARDSDELSVSTWILLCRILTRRFGMEQILPWTFPRWRENLIDLLRIAKDVGVPVDIPFGELTKEQRAIIMNGCKGFDGIYKYFQIHRT